MQLIEIISIGQFRLARGLIDHSHPYAELSHTWGEYDEEVTFRDRTNDTGNHKEGYGKFGVCGDQATRDKPGQGVVDSNGGRSTPVDLDRSPTNLEYGAKQPNRLDADSRQYNNQ